MTYSTVFACANDRAFVDRLQACIAQEQVARGWPSVQPGALIDTMRWGVSSAADVEAAYASALAASNPDPGGDPTVITDAMILAHVQAGWPV